MNTQTVYPWIHQYCNLKSSQDQLRPVHFPDVNPSSLPPETPFFMMAGDFLEIYNDSGFIKIEK